MAAYVLTRSVKHLAAWTRNEGYPTGRYRPICGGQLRGYSDTYRPDFEDPCRERRAERLPLCKLCAKELAQLVELTGVLR
jgi:hypothetical protein